MNVLYISYDGMTDPLGQSQVIPYLSGLSKKGHKIILISCEKKNRFQKQGSIIQELLNSNNIVWHAISYSTLPSILSKQLNLLRIKQKAYELCQAQKPDVVHCRSYMAALIGLQIKKKYGTKFIFDMRGFWADERIDGAIWSLKNKVQKQIYFYFKKKEIEFLSNADFTISLTQNAKDEILSWKQFQKKPIPIQVISCCADLNLFSEINIDRSKQQELKKNNTISENDFIISYLGSIGTWYMLEEMLDFFKRFLSLKANAKFLFITPEDSAMIFEKAETKGISRNKLIIQSANRNEVPAYLSLSQLSLYFIKPVYSKKASSPTKTGEIMALGIPIITNMGIGDSDKIISESGSGILIKNFTFEEYDYAINQIDVLLNTDKTKITNTAKKYFSLEKGIDLYQSVYESIAKSLKK
ncbi:MAG: glycosyltransferase [Bacteroidetes bacterium]|nr:glycosyltransferase [Bacteroidota bacterium]